MPIEIKELQIRVQISDPATSGASSSNPDAAGATPQSSGMSEEEMVQLCVEKVLEVLKEKEER